MSEPMTSAEKEDVLSSIRRLVSEDVRPAPRAVAPAAEGGKLLLTPALRVVAPPPAAPLHPLLAALPVSAPPPQETSAAGEDDEDPAPRSLPEDAPSMPSMFDAPFRSLRKAPLTAVREPSGDFGFASAVEEAISSDEGIDGLLDPMRDDVMEAPFAEDVPPLDSVVVALGAAVSAQPGQWEADGGDPQDLPAGAPWHPAAWFDADAAADPWVNEAAWAKPEDDADAQFDEGPASPRAPAEVWDEDQQRIADLAEAAAVAEIMASTAPAPKLAPVPEAGLDDGLLEEEMLRDLVREMIREELQGPLGERITRNIRKLVRAEISRAMSSREFD